MYPFLPLLSSAVIGRVRKFSIKQSGNDEYFCLQQPPALSVIARNEAISRIARLTYHRGVSLVKATDESSGLGGEIASSCLLAMTAGGCSNLKLVSLCLNITIYSGLITSAGLVWLTFNICEMIVNMMSMSTIR